MEKLKKWSKKDLRKEDWDFSGFAKLAKTTINRIFLWELDRELGSGQGSFLSYWENRDYRAKARKSDPCLEESDKSPNGDKLSTSHQFRVNWAATKPDLMAAFSNWLESSSAPHSAFSCKSRGPTAQPVYAAGENLDPSFPAGGLFGRSEVFPRGGEGQLPQKPATHQLDTGEAGDGGHPEGAPQRIEGDEASFRQKREVTTVLFTRFITGGFVVITGRS